MASADRLIEVFTEAKARPAGAERDHFLSEACRDEPELKQQVVALLQAHEGAGDFLQHTQFIPPPAPLTEKPGDKIGRYKLLEQIGEGGCGVVYMAEQEEPVRRRVALKVIKLGMDTKQVIARFEAERQALAMMDHPNIAKVLDGGATDTGRPFFVMELVRGIKITDYCDQNNLPTNARLELFMQVCQAIQHAHQKGIIHRDIKPSNILVTQHDDVAVPKVIDFGIAKATVGSLTDKTVFTAFAQFIGTPAYMSPEQAQMSGLDIDTRADIYSLGVLLYELLTGHTPFDAKELLAAGMDEMRRKIREEEPAKPSTCLSTMLAMDLATVAKHRHAEPPRLIHLIRGDLDWLVMKCLEKDRTRRYETANGLAADIKRHLANEPVVARPPSNLYRFQKLAHRNKLAFGAIAAVTTALVLGIIVSSWQALRATRAEHEQIKLREEADAGKKEAQTEAARSQQVAQFMKDMLNGVGPGVARGRDTALLGEILDQTAERLSKDLAGQPEVEAELHDTLGFIYRDLGNYSNAAAMHRYALAIRKKLHGNDHPAVASSLTGLGQALHRLGEHDAAESVYREALAMQKRLLGAEHADVASTLVNLGSVVRKKGNLTEAEPLLREALSIRRKLFGAENADVAESLNNLGLVLRAQGGKLAEAEQCFREALALRKALLGDDHFSVADTLGDLGRTLDMQSRLPEAEVLCREALALKRKLLGGEHPDLMDLLGRFVSVLQRQGKFPEAETVQREALALKTKLLGSEHPDVATSMRLLSVLLRRQSKWGEAGVVLQDLLVTQRRLLGNEHPEVASTFIALAQVLSNQDKLAEAEVVLRDLLASQRQVLDRKRPDLTPTLLELARVQDRLNKFPEAESSYEETLTLRRKQFGNDHKSVGALHVEMALLLAKEGKFPEADAAFGEALQVGKKLLRTNDSSVIAWLANFGAALHKQGKSAEAEKHYEETIASVRNTMGDSDPVLGMMLHSFAEFLLHQENKPAAAVEQYLAALPIRRAREDENLAWTLRNLGSALRQVGRAKDAELYLRESLAVSQKIGRQNPWALEQLAGALSEQGKPAEAEAALREALAFQKKSLGSEHLDVATSLFSLSFLLRQEGKLPEAETTAREALEIRKKLLGNENADVAHSLHLLAWNLNMQGKRAEAEVLSREELAMRRKLLGIEHPDVAWTLADLTVFLRDQKKLPEAETTIRESLAIRQKVFGNEHPDVAASLNLLADLLRAQGKLAELDKVEAEKKTAVAKP